MLSLNDKFSAHQFEALDSLDKPVAHVLGSLCRDLVGCYHDAVDVGHQVLALRVQSQHGHVVRIDCDSVLGDELSVGTVNDECFVGGSLVLARKSNAPVRVAVIVDKFVHVIAAGLDDGIEIGKLDVEECGVDNQTRW